MEKLRAHVRRGAWMSKSTRANKERVDEVIKTLLGVLISFVASGPGVGGFTHFLQLVVGGGGRGGGTRPWCWFVVAGGGGRLFVDGAMNTAATSHTVQHSTVQYNTIHTVQLVPGGCFVCVCRGGETYLKSEDWDGIENWRYRQTDTTAIQIEANALHSMT